MIIRKEPGGSLVLMGQTDHSRLVGQLAAHWGNRQFATPEPYDSIARAAAFHDYGWLRYETMPRFDPEIGETPEFRKVPNTTAQLEGFQWCADWLLGEDAHASLLVAMHRTGLWKGRYEAIKHPGHPNFKNLGPEVGAFIARSEAQQEHARRSVDAQQLWINYRLLQVWDLLGLYFCCQDPYVDYIEPVPVGYDAGRTEGVRLAMQPLSPRQVAFDPYPFAARPCHIQLAYRRLPQLRYPDQASFRRAYFTAELGVMQFELV